MSECGETRRVGVPAAEMVSFWTQIFNHIWSPLYILRTYTVSLYFRITIRGIYSYTGPQTETLCLATGPSDLVSSEVQACHSRTCSFPINIPIQNTYCH